MHQNLAKNPHQISSIAVFTGSATGDDDRFEIAAGEFATFIASRGIRTVYGGGRVGLMGVVADSAMRAGGEVIGVIPDSLMKGEVGHSGLTALEVVPDMHTRKARMADLADAFVALPGGIGTLEELFEVWTWQQLGIHQKPVALLNVNGFWDPLLAALDHMTISGFVTERFRATLIVADDPEKLLHLMATWEPEPPKWPETPEAGVTR